MRCLVGLSRSALRCVPWLAVSATWFSLRRSITSLRRPPAATRGPAPAAWRLETVPLDAYRRCQLGGRQPAARFAHRGHAEERRGELALEDRTRPSPSPSSSPSPRVAVVPASLKRRTTCFSGGVPRGDAGERTGAPSSIVRTRVRPLVSVGSLLICRITSFTGAFVRV